MLYANNYFSGDWINNDTLLTFEYGSLYLSHVNSVGIIPDTVSWTDATGDGLWNTSSQNWVRGEDAGLYGDNLAVVFGDTGAGTITIEGVLAPASVVVNSSADYVWNPSLTEGGKLTGEMTLTKQGGGTLTINTVNDYTGSSIIEGGTVVAGTVSALGSGNIELKGGTLEIAAAGLCNNIMASGNSTLKVQEGVTHELTGTIRNSGTLSMSGCFKADALGNPVQIADASLVNALGAADSTGGFSKSAVHGIQIATGNTVDSGAKITFGSNELQLGTDGWARMGGQVEYGSYLVGVGHLVKLSDITSSATAGGCNSTSVEINGGTLTADSSLTGVLYVNGSGCIVAQDWEVDAPVFNFGALSLSGSIIADGITNVEIMGAARVAVDGSTGSNGFIQNDGSKFTLVVGGGVTATDLSLTRNGIQYQLGSDGIATAEGAVLYDSYLVGSGHSVRISEIVNAAKTNGVNSTDIELNGGTLTADAALTGQLTISGNSTLNGDSWAIQQQRHTRLARQFQR